MSLPIPNFYQGKRLSADDLRGLAENIRDIRHRMRWPHGFAVPTHLPELHECIDFEFKIELRDHPDTAPEQGLFWRRGTIRGYGEPVLLGLEEWNLVETWKEGDKLDLYIHYETDTRGAVTHAEIKLEQRLVHHFIPGIQEGRYCIHVGGIDEQLHIVQHHLGPAIHHWVGFRNSDNRFGPPLDEGSPVPGIGHILRERDAQSWTARKLVAGTNVGITENEHSILISAGTAPGLDISIVPGPGIDADRTDTTAADGTHIIRYDIKGRLSQYCNWGTPDEQGDITAVHIDITPSVEPIPRCYPAIIDGDIRFSIVPGPITKVAAGNNIEIVETHSDSPAGWPIVTYTVSAKDSGGGISIVPGPGIAIDDITGGAPGPRVCRISKDIDLHGHSGITITEQASGNHIDYHIGLDPSALSIVPGPVADPGRPATGYNTAQMEANGWTKVSGYWADPTGHAHQCFMAIRDGKLYFHMFPSGFDS